jgi:hypothetical protein
MPLMGQSYLVLENPLSLFPSPTPSVPPHRFLPLSTAPHCFVGGLWRGGGDDRLVPPDPLLGIDHIPQAVTEVPMSTCVNPAVRCVSTCL